MLKVYLCGPLTKGDMGTNLRTAMEAASLLLCAGAAPFVPHLTFFLDLAHPLPYEDWMAYDFTWILACDWLLRLPGESPGVEREVAFAITNGIPVWTKSVPEFVKAVAEKETLNG